MKLDFCAFTDKGKRNVNEDYIGYESIGSSTCFIVCDGLGGMGRGDEASSCVVNTILDYYRQTGDAFDIDQAFILGQEALLALQRESNAEASMKTTAVILFIKDNMAYFGHIGDSRLYCFNNDGFIRTLDHSIPQILVSQGEISERDIRFHSDRNKLVRVMGNNWSKPNCYNTVKAYDISNTRAFLMCTDGFWELIDENDMVNYLIKSRSSKKWLSLMKKHVLENGRDVNMDNYSAIAIRL